MSPVPGVPLPKTQSHVSVSPSGSVDVDVKVMGSDEDIVHVGFIVNEAIGAPGTLPPAPLVLAALVLLVLAALLADVLVVLAVEVASVESSLHPKTKANTAAPPSHTHCTVRMTRSLATALARRNPTHQ